MTIPSWIRKLFTRPVTRTIRTAPRRARLTLEALEGRWVPSAVTVFNTTDVVNGDTSSITNLLANRGADGISLREAVTAANNTAGDDTIDFDSSVFSTLKTITLGGTVLTLSDTDGTTTITGPAAGVTVSGGKLSQVFQVDANVTAAISGLKITGGVFTLSAQIGGGLVNFGTTTLTNCTVSGNRALQGGGVFNTGTVTLTDCIVSGNVAQGPGGGLYNLGLATLTNCTVSGNVAQGPGGGLYNLGLATLTNCTVTGNTAVRGGGLYNAATPSPTTSITPTLNLANTIVAVNTAGISSPDVQGVFSSLGHNLVGTTDGSSGWVGSDLTGTIAVPRNPLLAPIGPNVFSLFVGSPALDAGSNALLTLPTPSNVALAAVDSGGNLADTTSFFYRVSALNQRGETLASAEQSITTGTSGGLNSVTINFSLVPGATAYRIYGRAQGTEQLLATVDGLAAALSIQGSGFVYTDTGAATPSGALPPANTTTPTTDMRGLARIANGTVDIGAIEAQPALDPVGLVVNTTADELDFSNDATSLREAIWIANSFPGGTITFDPTDFAIPRTITLGGTQLQLSNLNNTAGTTTITGPAARVTVSGGGLSRVFQVDANVTATISGLTITGGQTGFDVSTGGGLLNLGTTTLTNCTVSGNSAGQGAGVFNRGMLTLTDCSISANITSGPAGGLENRGTATLTNCTISGNTSTVDGGGVKNFGTLTLTDCTISDNTAGQGGGLANISGTLTMSNCTVSGNTTTGSFGGGLIISGTATLTNCTVSGNTAPASGGLSNGGTLTMTNCTVTGNSASAYNGGGLDNGGTLTMTNCTVSGNTASGGSGGGLVNSGTVTLGNTIIAGNTASMGPDVASGFVFSATRVAGGSGYTDTSPPTVAFSGGGGSGAAGTPLIFGGSVVFIQITDSGIGYTSAPTITISGGDGSGASFTANIRGAIISLGHNLIGKTNGSGGWVASDLTGTIAHPLNPKLAPLANNGGPTATMALKPGSPASNAGNNSLIPDGITTDQRGLPRTSNGTVDIGAFEATGAAAPRVTAIRVARFNRSRGLLTYRVIFNHAVTGVNGSDFQVIPQGALSAQLRSVVRLSASVYKVQILVGSSAGSVQLRLRDNNSIHDLSGNPLGGPLVGDGSFFGPVVRLRARSSFSQ